MLDGHFGLPAVPALLAILSFAEAATGRLRSERAPSSTTESSDSIVFAAESFVSFTALFLAVQAIRYTILDDDNLCCYLPMVAEWIRTKSIAPVASIPIIARGYPALRESLLAFLSLPLRNEHLALSGCLEVIMFALAIHQLARRFGAPPRVSGMGGGKRHGRSRR